MCIKARLPNTLRLNKRKHNRKKTMRKPRISQCFNKDEYWEKAESVRATCGRLPVWSFDFISVHMYALQDNSVFGLCSPMCLVEENEKSLRPAFESVSFRTKTDAINAAKQIASGRKKHHLFVVDCCDSSRIKPKKEEGHGNTAC